ncbi:NUDIX domain-containing protein [Yoonia sp. MH D7]
MDDDFTGAKAALFIGGELLITLRDDFAHIPFPNLWDFPGGGREAGETPLQTMRREVMEEVGLVVPDASLVWRRKYERNWFFVAVLPVGAEREIVFGDEGQGWRLVDLEAFFALTDVVPFFPQRVRDWLAYDALKSGADLGI